MKIQIDTSNKTITVMEVINLGDLITGLSKIFPEEGWREYTLYQNYNNLTPFTNPYVVPYNQPLSRTLPWIQQGITYGTGITTSINPSTLTSSVYNVELKP